MLVNVRAKARVNQKSRLRMPHKNRRHPVFVTSAPTPAAISEGLPRWHFARLEDRKRDLRQLRWIGPAARSFRRRSLVRRHVQFHRREGVSQQRQQQDHDYSRDLQRRFYHFLHRRNFFTGKFNPMVMAAAPAEREASRRQASEELFTPLILAAAAAISPLPTFPG